MPSKPRRVDLARSLAAVARLHGWQHHRCGAGCGTSAGEPDGFPTETLVRGDRLLFVFLVRTRHSLTPLQRLWASALAGVRIVEVRTITAENPSAITAALKSDADSWRAGD